MGEFSCSLAILELVASLVVDLSDQRLTVYNSDHEVVRVHANHLLIAVVNGQALVGEVDHKVGDELEYGEGTTELALAVSAVTH